MQRESAAAATHQRGLSEGWEWVRRLKASLELLVTSANTAYHTPEDFPPASVRAPAQSSSQLCTHRSEPTWDSFQGGTLFSPSLDSIKVLLKNSLSSEIRLYFIMITQIPQHIKLTTIYLL